MPANSQYGELQDRYNNYVARTGYGLDAAGRPVYSGAGMMYMGPREFSATQDQHNQLASQLQKAHNDAERARQQQAEQAALQQQKAAEEQAAWQRKMQEEQLRQQAEASRQKHKSMQSLAMGMGVGGFSPFRQSLMG